MKFKTFSDLLSFYLVPLFILFNSSVACAQQVADTLYIPKVAVAPKVHGQVVLIDEAHNNFHTMNGRYLPFTRVLQRDGYVVKPGKTKIYKANLDNVNILVIANALAKQNVGNWYLPIPSAFDSTEIATIKKWVANGGSLWLIADHMPFPGAVESLASEFSVLMGNGFAMDTESNDPALIFSHYNKLLAEHPITKGRNPAERIDSVVSFTGQGFRIIGKGEPLMTIGKGIQLLMPQVAWEFTKLTPSMSATGMLQGAVIQFEKGRVAVFGEAAMFSAQLSGPSKTSIGMNNPLARKNGQFLLNVAHWLSGLL
jgi:hypothetical protein